MKSKLIKLTKLRSNYITASWDRRTNIARFFTDVDGDLEVRVTPDGYRVVETTMDLSGDRWPSMTPVFTKSLNGVIRWIQNTEAYVQKRKASCH
jgi:hypothetical protein